MTCSCNRDSSDALGKTANPCAGISLHNIQALHDRQGVTHINDTTDVCDSATHCSIHLRRNMQHAEVTARKGFGTLGLPAVE